MFWKDRDESDLKNAIDSFTKSVEFGCNHAAFDLGRMYFSGRFVKRDIEKAYQYMLTAARNDESEARQWIGFFLDDEKDAVIGEEAEERNSTIRFYHRSIRSFNFPDRSLVDCPEWIVLLDICDLDGHCCCCSEDLASSRGGFENDTFAIRPFYWNDDKTESEIPNFIFKPTGFEIEWYKYPFRDSYMNRRLNEKQIRHIWRLCIESVVEQYSKRWEQ